MEPGDPSDLPVSDGGVVTLKCKDSFVEDAGTKTVTCSTSGFTDPLFQCNGKFALNCNSNTLIK